jgi:hypothetical protein
MPNPSQGWYADPHDPNAERWWDGSAWSEHVRPVVPAPAVPAGWYDDPHVAGQLRYWDGVAWTEHTGPQHVPSPSSTLTPPDTTAAPVWSQPAPSHDAAPAPQPWMPQSWPGTDASAAGNDPAPWSEDSQNWGQTSPRAFPQHSRTIPVRPTAAWSQLPGHAPHPPKEATFASRLKGKEKRLATAIGVVFALIFGLQAGISEYREKSAENASSVPADYTPTSEDIAEWTAEEEDRAARTNAKDSTFSGDRVTVAARDGSVYEFDAIYYDATSKACTNMYDSFMRYIAAEASTGDSLKSREDIKKESVHLAAMAAVYEVHADLLAAIGELSTSATINDIALSVRFSKRAELQEYFKQRAEKIALIAEGLTTASNERDVMAVIKKHGFASGNALADYLVETSEAWEASFDDNSVGIGFTAKLVPSCASFVE